MLAASMISYYSVTVARPDGYQATAELTCELARAGQASYDTGRYRATVASCGPGYYEAWTDTLPFVYGRPAATLEGAIANLEEAVRESAGSRSTKV